MKILSVGVNKMFIICEKNRYDDETVRYFDIGYCDTKEEAIEAVNSCVQDTIKLFQPQVETAEQLEEKYGISFLYRIIDRFDFDKFKSGDFGD